MAIWCVCLYGPGDKFLTQMRESVGSNPTKGIDKKSFHLFPPEQKWQHLLGYISKDTKKRNESNGPGQFGTTDLGHGSLVLYHWAKIFWEFLAKFWHYLSLEIEFSSAEVWLGVDFKFDSTQSILRINFLREKGEGMSMRIKRACESNESWLSG